MNGAQALLRTLTDGGVTTCFSNPGTSEMHFVAALDSEPRMRAVLTLFEGVATGAADGYARMADSPAATLLHLGPGLGNGLANLHNARKGHVPVVNIVGDHATSHVRYDAPLQSDIETVARNVSTWIRRSESPQTIGRDAAETIAAASGPPGAVATLILPADVSWSEGAEPSPPPPAASPVAVASETVEAVAHALKGGGRCALLLGGGALREGALRAAARAAAASGARLLCEVFPTRLQRGAGLPTLERLAYLPELAGVQLSGLRHLILVQAATPVSFFAYPGRTGELVPSGCKVHELADASQDAAAALDALAELLGPARSPVEAQTAHRPQAPRGALTAERTCEAIGTVLPEGAIISDESQTSGVALSPSTAGAPPHDVLTLTGGSIGQGLPVAVGAAVACPDRPVFALQADGSSLYTIQSLWTMAREQLDITVVIFRNDAYAILELELQRVGAPTANSKARAQFDLSNPTIDFVSIATGFGVPARRAETTEEVLDALRWATAEPGPHLIEAVVPSVFGPRRLRAMPYALRTLSVLPRPLATAIKRRVYPG
jgi:acetolactate synthase-1/2/3 large subunit